ncbi:MAG: polyisoprenoid-binding protein [Betaproteobacteria bacterium]|mgnify:CR=1 FL=1|jgi:polyisoprenoid-binding protein YceI|nr:polyisoprenoid-binding protein [Betaproteobacteria bacterium]HMV19882.1 YceI family protein [Rhodocyclaceae bacterium]HMW77013.1 YceI family protein [Rhodocyclaceae bacterium]HNE42141.1 YceI family protein [Rhodocyclaceae bacterium]HNL20555.1 YceI family protein [Rhodocyclaceae bacterium]
MKRLFALAALATTLSTHSFAAPETYTVDNEHTYPSFTYNHLGFSTQTHRFLKTSGTVVWDKAAETGSVDITIDAKSVDAGSAIFAEHIQAPELFDTANYPTITFKSTGVKFKDGDPVSIDGNLTIKGITKPVTLTVTQFAAKINPMVRRDAIGANAVTKIKRSDFNVSKAVPFVSDEVTLNIVLEAHRP